MPRLTAVLMLFLIGLAVALGCSVKEKVRPEPEDNLKHSDPLIVVAALQELAREKRVDLAPRILPLLEDPRPELRFWANYALCRITGEDPGFLPYASQAERHNALLQWRSLVASGAAEEATGTPDGSAASEQQGAETPEVSTSESSEAEAPRDGAGEERNGEEREDELEQEHEHEYEGRATPPAEQRE